MRVSFLGQIGAGGTTLHRAFSPAINHWVHLKPRRKHLALATTELVSVEKFALQTYRRARQRFRRSQCPSGQAPVTSVHVLCRISSTLNSLFRGFSRRCSQSRRAVGVIRSIQTYENIRPDYGVSATNTESSANYDEGNSAVSQTKPL